MGRDANDNDPLNFRPAASPNPVDARSAFAPGDPGPFMPRRAPLSVMLTLREAGVVLWNSGGDLILATKHEQFEWMKMPRW